MELKRSHGLSFYELEMTPENCSESYTIAREFVENLFFLMSKLSTKLCNLQYDFCDLPYTYTERRLDSVLLPALSKLCDSLVLTELPANRKTKDKTYIGRIDYWCIYKGYSFIIELKQSYDNSSTDNTRREEILDQWNTMIQQLNSVKAEASKYEEKTNGVIRLGLHMITSYNPISPSEEIIKGFNKQKIENIAHRLYNHIGKKTPLRKPDLLICWKIPSWIVERNEDCSYLGLWTVAKIYSPIQHKGSR
jgi:hypothetical protein